MCADFYFFTFHSSLFTNSACTDFLESNRLEWIVKKWGWFATQIFFLIRCIFVLCAQRKSSMCAELLKSSSSPRSISISQLHALLHFHLWPIKLVVYKWPYSLKGMGYLILRCASRLDAFSVYHDRTRLPGYALGRTTDAPEVRPTRSSRTKVSSSQISNAHDR